MDVKKVFIGAVAACLLVVCIAIGISVLVQTEEPDYGSIHTTEAESTEAEQETPVVITIPETEETERETETSRSETQPQTTAAPLAQYEVTIDRKVFGNGNVSIAYPIVSNMEDEALQEKVNQNLSGNATAILSLYPVDVNTDRLEISCTVNYIDRRRISVIYTGILYQGQQSAGTAGETQTSAAQDNSQLAPGETWAQPGAQGGLPENLQATNLAPGERAGGGLGNGETDTQGRRIFYTNTVNLRTGSSMSLRDFVDARTLGGYVLQEDCQFETTDQNLLSYIRVYLSAHDSSYYEAIFQNADFPLKTQGWPQSFCYENKGDIVFSIPVSSALGDYVLARYVPETK